MNKLHFYKSYLKFTAVFIGLFGPVFFFGTMLKTSEPARLSLDILCWPVDGVQTYLEPTTRFLSALTGGFLFGWGVCIWCLQKWVYDHAPEEVRKSVVTGLAAWFLLDSAGSFTSGNASNILFNIIVLLISVGPLWKKI
ncbi:MAG: hypothetical protein LWX56_14220 [Ignavibacteria bacterium]|nr:hypothetical protein [Ignavibacteria bacterium]